MEQSLEKFTPGSFPDRFTIIQIMLTSLTDNPIFEMEMKQVPFSTDQLLSYSGLSGRDLALTGIYYFRIFFIVSTIRYFFKLSGHGISSSISSPFLFVVLTLCIILTLV